MALQTQINQIIAPTGEAPSAAEVQNARIGSNGITYTTLGEAIRNQFSNIYTELSTTTFKINKLNDNLVNGKYLNLGGTETNNTSWTSTSFIELVSTDIVLFLTNVSDIIATAGYNVVIYNQNKEMIQDRSFVFDVSVSRNIFLPIHVSSDCRYIRVCSTTAETDWVNGYIVQSNESFNLLNELNIIKKQSLNNNLRTGYVNKHGQLTSQSDWRSTQFIQLVGNRFKISFIKASDISTSIGYNISFYTGNYEFMSEYSKKFSGNGVINEYHDVPYNAKYLVISSAEDYTHNSWDGAYIVQFNALNKTPTIKTVSKNGFGDYETITDAVANAVSGDVILVKGGNYENEHIEGWGKTITIIGDNVDNVIVSCSDSTYADPCIEFSTRSIYNITFKKLNNGAGTGYAFHSEDDYSYNKSLYIENCKFISIGGHTPVGIGMRGGANLTFRHCSFIADAQGPAFYLHDSNINEYIGTNNVFFDNCYFENRGNWIMTLQSQEKPGARVNIKFKNTNFYRVVDESSVPYISPVNYFGGQSTDPDDFLGLINWRLDQSSTGNNFTILNRLPMYNGI